MHLYTCTVQYLFAANDRVSIPGTSANQASNELHEGTGMKLSSLPRFKQELLVNPVGPTGRCFSARSKISAGMRDEFPGRLSGLGIHELKPKVNSSRQM